MKLNCNVIRDLLPLYVDQVCSSESRQLVDEHLTQCVDCTALLRQMLRTENEMGLKSEAESVIYRQATFFRRKSAVAGTVIAGIFTIPIFVGLIVNLASGAALDWFFIVLASLVTAASLIVVPLLAAKNKFLWTLGTFTASLTLLFGVICIYTRGDWFFVVLAPVLFGLAVCFLPFAVCTKPLRALLGRQKGLTVMAADTALFALMMFSIRLYTGSAEFREVAPSVSVPVLLWIWALFLLIRYPKCNGLIRAGVCTAITGIFAFSADKLINAWIGIELPMPVFHPFVWNIDTVDGNVKWLLLLSGVLGGMVLLIFGIIKTGKTKS